MPSPVGPMAAGGSEGTPAPPRPVPSLRSAPGAGLGRAAALAAPAAREMLGSSLGFALTYSSPGLSF